MSASLHQVLVLVLAFQRLLLAFSTRANTSSRHMSITVKWGREKLHIPLPPQHAKLASLRATLAEHTALPPASFKLIHAGAVMKDDNASIATYGIHPNSIIALIGGNDKPLPKAPSSTARKPKQNTPATEQTTIATIRAELSSVQETIAPSLDQFLTVITPEIDGPPHVTKSAAELEFEHARLGELLLQSLLRLDVLVMDGAWSDARLERKGAVRAVQNLLDRLDGGWKTHREKVE